MSILDSILKASGGNTLATLAKQFGLNENQTSDALRQLVPAVNAGIKRNVQSDQGLSSFLGALEKGSHERFLDNPEELTRDTAVQEGNSILGHIFGNKDVSRQVASRAAESSGVDSGVLKKMLPLVAGMVMGNMRKESGFSAPGVPAKVAAPSTGALTKLLDRDGDGSIVDDLWGFAKKMM